MSYNLESPLSFSPPPYAYFAGVTRAGATVTFEGGVPTLENWDEPTVATAILSAGGAISGLTSAFPGGGTVKHSAPADINGRGVPRVVATILADGSIAPASFGLIACAKSATGTYLLTHNFGSNSTLQAIAKASIRNYETEISHGGNVNVLTVKVYDPSGNLADGGFVIELF
jgi:hypothetical protein